MTTDPAASWVRDLPRRRAMWGAAIGAFWVAGAVVWFFTGAPSEMGVSASSLPLLILMWMLIMILPLALLGLAWGWYERHRLERAFADGGAARDRAIEGLFMRHVGRAFLVGTLLGAIEPGISLLLTPEEWNTYRFLTATVSTGIGGFFVGLVVGAVAEKALKRRLQQQVAAQV